jgi:hypothetical protein
MSISYIFVLIVCVRINPSATIFLKEKAFIITFIIETICLNLMNFYPACFFLKWGEIERSRGQILEKEQETRKSFILIQNIGHPAGASKEPRTLVRRLPPWN